jgi:hypothetical protein
MAGGSTAVAAVVGIDTYGESAPAPVLFKHFGFTRRERGRHRASGIDKTMSELRLVKR